MCGRGGTASPPLFTLLSPAASHRLVLFSSTWLQPSYFLLTSASHLVLFPDHPGAHAHSNTHPSVSPLCMCCRLQSARMDQSRRESSWCAGALVKEGKSWSEERVMKGAEFRGWKKEKRALHPSQPQQGSTVLSRIIILLIVSDSVYMLP